jgi:predicted nucleic acid-binding Zn ribbon protein
MKEDPIKNCPDCEGEMKRLIGSGAGAIFKGSGFYHTDYKNSSKTADTQKTKKPKIAEKTSAEITTNKTRNSE